jgi:hypothetical protein
MAGFFGITTRINPNQFIRPQPWSVLTRHFDNLHVVYKAGGMSAVVAALRHADDLDQLRFTSRIANQFQDKTAAVLHFLKSRTFGLFKHYRIAKSVQLAMGGWAGLWALAMTALLSTLFSAVRSRVFRFITLRWLRRIDERRIAREAAA